MSAYNKKKPVLCSKSKGGGGRKAQGSAAIIGPECFKNNLKTVMAVSQHWSYLKTGWKKT